MTTPEIFAALLLPAIFAACLWRARLLSLAIIPPMLLAISQTFDIVDTERASHPYRWIVPVACAGLAGASLAYYVAQVHATINGRRVAVIKKRDPRAAVASLLVLGSCAPDLLALHPFFWAIFTTWALTPIQLAAELAILAVLVAPERWVRKCLR
jgi:hypothetical protein